VKTSNSQRIISPRVVIQLLFFIVFIPCLPLLVSGRWDWWEAWVYAILSVFAFVISRVLAARRHPDLIAERARFMQHENAKPWDRRLVPLFGLGGALVLLVAGLDERFGWSPAFSWQVKALTLVMIVAGYALSSCALIENRFFSGMVRIQTERGHQVVLTGPYRWVRLYRYSMAIGRDRIASMTNTLLLAYVGAALPLFLLLASLDIPLAQTLNREFIAEEIVRTLVGSLGLILAVPVTSLLAGLLAQKHHSGALA
jgi:protein-S-isoprenylcysteine O-methyltransferase Ste14